MIPVKTALENTIGKREIAGNQYFLLFPQWQFYSINESNQYSSNINFVICKSMGESDSVVSAYTMYIGTYNSIALTHQIAFSSVTSEILSFGEGLTHYQAINVRVDQLREFADDNKLTHYHKINNAPFPSMFYTLQESGFINQFAFTWMFYVTTLKSKNLKYSI